MNKLNISIIIVLLVVVLGFLFLGKGKKLEAPADNVGTNMPAGNMGNMTPPSIPADYNAPLPASTAPVKEFTVTGQNFSFTPNTLAVNKGDVVKITFKNAGGFHDFRIAEYKVATPVIKTGEDATVSFIADTAGTFQYFCSVGQHRSMGMWGTLTVK